MIKFEIKEDFSIHHQLKALLEHLKKMYVNN